MLAPNWESNLQYNRFTFVGILNHIQYSHWNKIDIISTSMLILCISRHNSNEIILVHFVPKFKYVFKKWYWYILVSKDNLKSRMLIIIFPVNELTQFWLEWCEWNISKFSLMISREENLLYTNLLRLTQIFVKSKKLYPI